MDAFKEEKLGCDLEICSKARKSINCRPGSIASQLRPQGQESFKSRVKSQLYH